MKQVFKHMMVSITVFCIWACNNNTKPLSDAGGDTAANRFDFEKVKAAIKEENTRYVNAVVNGDSATAADHYSKDALILAPGTELVEGDKILPFYGGLLKGGFVKDASLNTETLTGNEEFIIETGNYALHGENNSLLEKGKYLGVWKQENGVWKIFRTSWNTNTPTMPVK